MLFSLPSFVLSVCFIAQNKKFREHKCPWRICALTTVATVFTELFQPRRLWGFISAPQTWWKYNLLISSVNEFTYCLFLPCCPATIATSPVVNLPVRRHKYQPGILLCFIPDVQKGTEGWISHLVQRSKEYFCQIWAFYLSVEGRQKIVSFVQNG